MFLIHGGPQGEWGDGWSSRWNASLWASQGWVVVAPNRRGSTGVPAEALVFSDEGHWVLNALDSKRWHEAVFGWMKKYLAQ